MDTAEIVDALVIVVADKEPKAENLAVGAMKETIVTHFSGTNTGTGPFNPSLLESAPQIVDIFVALAEDMVVVVAAMAAKVMVET